MTIPDCRRRFLQCLRRGTTGALTQGFEMILGSLCVLIAACWSNFLVEFATIKFASAVRFLLVRIQVFLDRSSSASIGHRVFDGIVLLLALRVGASVLLRVCGFNSRGIMRILCEIREKSSDQFRFREDVGMLRLLPKSKPCVGGYKCCSDGGGDQDGDEDGEEGDDGEYYPEDEEFDVHVLRRLVKKERKRADVACKELEKERAATASAIDETMAMIARLQGEKNAAEVRASQERRMAAQKQTYDQEVIESLRWMLVRSEGRFRRWGRKLKMSDDDDDVFGSEDNRDVLIISSLEFDSLQRSTCE